MDNKVKKLVNKLDIGNLKAFSWLGSGYVSHAYQVDTSSGSYVLLEQKKGSDEEVAYKYHYAVLKCLEAKKYAYAPKAVYISEDGQTLLMTKSQGVQANQLSALTALGKKTIATNIADALLALQTIKPKDLASALKGVGLKMPEPINDETAWKTYTIDTFYSYKDLAPKDAHKKWLKDQIESHAPMKTNSKDMYFIHGDSGGSNTLIDRQFNVTFVDWSLAKFFMSNKDQRDFELAYAMNHTAIMNELQDYVLEYVSKKQKTDLNTLKKVVFVRRKGIKISDICWAFMMYTKASMGQAADKPEVFKEILDTRIEEYKKEFA